MALITVGQQVNGDDTTYKLYASQWPMFTISAIDSAELTIYEK